MILNKPANYTFNGKESQYNEFDTTSRCPRCSHSISPDFVSLTKTSDFNMTITLFCKNCNKVFLSDYYYSTFGNTKWNLRTSYPLNHSKEIFDETINIVSPTFVKIFNQAKQAEISMLDEIAGVGYRKSLEFLVKDYAIYLNKEDEVITATIKKMSLVQCIENYINHARINAITKRAAWLGNDETHYVKKYTEEDIETLKALVKLSVNWITMDLDSAALEERIVHPSQLETTE